MGASFAFDDLYFIRMDAIVAEVRLWVERMTQFPNCEERVYRPYHTSYVVAGTLQCGAAHSRWAVDVHESDLRGRVETRRREAFNEMMKLRP